MNFNLRLAHDRNDKQNYEDEASHYGQSVYHGRGTLCTAAAGSLQWDTRFSCFVSTAARTGSGANDLMQNNDRPECADTRDLSSRLPRRRH